MTARASTQSTVKFGAGCQTGNTAFKDQKSAGQPLIQVFADPMQQDVVPPVALAIPQTFIVQNASDGPKRMPRSAQRGKALQNPLFLRTRRQMHTVPRGETEG